MNYLVIYTQLINLLSVIIVEQSHFVAASID